MPLQAPGGLPPGNTPYPLDIVIGGGLSATQATIIQSAADRWRRAILSSVPVYVLNGVPTAGMVVTVDAAPLGAGVEGKTDGPDYRPVSQGWFPVSATITFNSAIIGQLEAGGQLHFVAEHELAHALGFGSNLWVWNNLVAHDVTGPLFTGAEAMAEYGRLHGAGPTQVPIENQGGPGVANIHWRDAVFGDELMSSYEPNTALSRMTLASLSDLGYVVDPDAGDAYVLPRADNLALRLNLPHGLGQRRSHDAQWARTPGRVLPEQPVAAPH